MTTADALAALDLEGSGRFSLPGLPPLVAARDMPWDAVVRALEDDVYFIKTVAGGHRMPLREIGRVRSFWRQQQGLLEGDDLRRLLWIVAEFREAIEVDLLQRVGVRLGDLWQRREWRLLLNLIDHLPRATWSWQLMANHREYAERIAEAVARRKATSIEEDTGPSLVEWSAESALLAGVIDSVNALRTTLIQTNLEKGKSAPQIPPYPRPRTLVDTMVDKKERALRWAAHNDLANRMLPGRDT